MPIRVGNDGKGEAGLGDVVDVGDPAIVGGEVVGRLGGANSTY